jgi:hypothetical protein
MEKSHQKKYLFIVWRRLVDLNEQTHIETHDSQPDS